jgi:hypothetical protein
LSRPHSAKGLTSVPDAAWETARRRERIIRALLQNPVAYGVRSEAVAAAAAELDVTIQYLYRLIKVYEADPRTRSLLPRSPGGAPRSPLYKITVGLVHPDERGCRIRDGKLMPPEARPARPRRDAGTRASPDMPRAVTPGTPARETGTEPG